MTAVPGNRDNRTRLTGPLISIYYLWLIIFMTFDVCVVGGGAAGLLAAVFAGRGGGSVAVIERNTSVGRKLLRTGRGRCNITHVGDVRDLVAAFGQCGRFLRHCLYEFSGEDTISFFSKLGVKTKVEKQGCVFPVSDKAGSVKRALLEEAQRCGVEFVYGKRVCNISKRDGGFVVDADGVEVSCGAVIIATGGKSWPELGSTGDGFELAEKFGHTVIKPMPALVGLVCEDKWMRRLQGVAVGDVKVWAKVAGKKVSQCGPMMFTDKGIGGPAVFNFSRLIVERLGEDKKGLDVFIDLLPEMNEGRLRKCFAEGVREHPRKTVVNVIAELLPRRLAVGVVERAGSREDLCMSGFGKGAQNKLIELVKRLPVRVVSAGGFAEATITRGGVKRDEINSKTMESKICRGLYFAGEVIDADGPCGGYNLQIAWSTGVLAGKIAISAT